MKPIGFQLKSLIPSNMFDSEAKDYLKNVKTLVKDFLDKNTYGDHELLNSPDRKFFIMQNNLGPMKSAYAEACV